MTTPPYQGFSTLVNHLGEGENDRHAHIMPIYQTSSFHASDLDDMMARFAGESTGYLYTRVDNPNIALLGQKIAQLEGWGSDQSVHGLTFASGMAAISGAILAYVQAGDTVLAQRSLYGGAFHFLSVLLPRYGGQVVWVDDVSPEGWAAAFAAHPHAKMVYTETPINPTLTIVDLRALAEIAHQYGAWVMVDNTFATPYCQRPLSLGVDVVVHSTTKYLTGHGVMIGGAVVSPHADFMQNRMQEIRKILGAVSSPFDAWLGNLGLRTFELRMARHCENAQRLAEYLSAHPQVTRVCYPGLESHPGHAIANEQMYAYGGMLSFEMRGGLEAGRQFIKTANLLTLAGTLGNADSLVAHPASMSHASIPPEIRQQIGVTDGLIRLSVGIENITDLLADVEQALDAI